MATEQAEAVHLRFSTSKKIKKQQKIYFLHWQKKKKKKKIGTQYTQVWLSKGPSS